MLAYVPKELNAAEALNPVIVVRSTAQVDSSCAQVVDSPGPFSGEAFGVRGVFSRARGPSPATTIAFGSIEGILEEAIGSMPPAVVTPWGDIGVLQRERGPTPAHVLEAEERAAEALAVSAFIESHADAQRLPGGKKVRCLTTGHELPLNLFWMTSHWEVLRPPRSVSHCPPPPLRSLTQRSADLPLFAGSQVCARRQEVRGGAGRGAGGRRAASGADLERGPHEGRVQGGGETAMHIQCRGGSPPLALTLTLTLRLPQARASMQKKLRKLEGQMARLDAQRSTELAEAASGRGDTLTSSRKQGGTTAADGASELWTMEDWTMEDVHAIDERLA